jgi:hypothetical protein
MIDNLNALDIDALRAEWRELFRTEPPAMRSASLLRMELAWILQARVFGDLDARTRRRLKAFVRTDSDSKVRKATRLLPGTVLLREWRGHTYRVEVLESGFLFERERFSSLSSIARQIAGVRWSGPRFFRLDGPDRQKSLKGTHD